MILSVHFIANAKSLEIGSISDIVKSGINSEDDIDRSESRRVSRDISVEREREDKIINKGEKKVSRILRLNIVERYSNGRCSFAPFIRGE